MSSPQQCQLKAARRKSSVGKQRACTIRYQMELRHPVMSGAGLNLGIRPSHVVDRLLCGTHTDDVGPLHLYCNN